MQIGAQKRRTVIPHLKPILNTSILKIEMQIEMKLYIFLSVQRLRQIATQMERRGGTVEHFPVGVHAPPVSRVQFLPHQVQRGIERLVIVASGHANVCDRGHRAGASFITAFHFKLSPKLFPVNDFVQEFFDFRRHH